VRSILDLEAKTFGETYIIGIMMFDLTDDEGAALRLGLRARPPSDPE
jgi:hypothetical protein